MKHPWIHVVVAGGWGSGKTRFASSFPKPLISLQTDPYGKEAPLLDRGLVGETVVGLFGQYVTTVNSKLDPTRLLCQIEFFHDADPRKPQAFRQFRNRFDTLFEEVQASRWATVVIDGVTFLELISRKLYQHDEVKGKEPRRWYAQSTEDLEELLMCRAGALRCNVVVCAHLDKSYNEVSGVSVHHPAAPGRMSTRFGAGFPEMYVAHCLKQSDGQVKYWLQTRTDSQCAASSVFLEAPDPCEPVYKALWATWDAKHPATVVNDGGTAANNGSEAAKEEKGNE